MRRFHFHLEHSQDIRDEVGVDLPDLAAAKCHAVQMIAEMLCGGPQAFWDADQYRVTVAEAGLILLSVEMVATLAAALRSDIGPIV